MLVLLIVLASMAVLAIAGSRYGVDSRPGFCDRNRRIPRGFNSRVLSPAPHQFH
jgi:hypothetical protein